MGRGNDFVLCTHPCIRSAADFNVAATRNGLDSAGISASGSPTGRVSFEGSLELPFSVIFPNQPTVSLKIKFPF